MTFACVPQGIGLSPLLFSPHPYTDSTAEQTLFCIPTVLSSLTPVLTFTVYQSEPLLRVWHLT